MSTKWSDCLWRGTILVSSLNIQYCNQMELRRELCKRSGTDELHLFCDPGGILIGLVPHRKHNHRFVVQEYVLWRIPKRRQEAWNVRQMLKLKCIGKSFYKWFYACTYDKFTTIFYHIYTSTVIYASIVMHANLF